MGKHITDAQRLQIEHRLKEHASLKSIASEIGKSHTTISREILQRREESLKGAPGRVPNRCISRRNCTRTQLCFDRPDCVRKCSLCKWCNLKCSDYREEACTKLDAPPYVCNGCPTEKDCTLRKQFYLHRCAQKNYRDLLEKSREGANITQNELLDMDAVLTGAVRNGQSIHHVMTHNPDRFTVSEKTVYRYAAGGLLAVKNGDMPRVCALRPRKSKPVEHKVDSKCRVGRTYAEFQAFMAEHPDTPVAEMDSVIGRVGGKVLLTVYFRSSAMLFAFLRERNDSRSVLAVFGQLWSDGRAGPDLFRRMFPVILTDNGSEFSNPSALEFAPDGSRRTFVFYCDACASWQKGGIERDHEFLRMVLPKGTNFDDLTQDNVNLVLSHVNCYSRPSREDKSPYDLFAFRYGTTLLDKLGIRKIAPNDIVLKPSLLAR
jgi:IS30 family transposase